MRRAPYRPTTESHAAAKSSAGCRAFHALTPPAPTDQRGFTLVELIVVIAIVVLLTSLLMPGLRAMRETANRLACGSNMRQLGYAVTAYANDYNDYLPASHFSKQEVKQPAELMAVTTGGEGATFEGLGRLLPRCGFYLDSAACLYCPSHTGDHTYEKYAIALTAPAGQDRAYANYHYRGDMDLTTGARFRLNNDHDFVLATDGLRMQSDFNHRDGLNVLFGDLAVSFHSDTDETLRQSLPATGEPTSDLNFYSVLWGDVLGANN